MSKANGQVRPAWMGETGKADDERANAREEDQAPQTGERDDASEEAENTAPGPEETAAPAPESNDSQAEPEDATALVGEAPLADEPQTAPHEGASGADHTERSEVPPEHSGGHEDSARQTYPQAPSFGKKDSGGETSEQNSYPRPASAAPTGIRAAISSFVERFSSRRTPAPGPAEPTPSRQESPEQVEKRLKVSLRETTIEGFRRIAFGSPKGGVGKSSLAYTVAGAIASMTNLRICLVDADPNFGATRYLVPRPVEQSVLDLAEDADRLERLADLRTYVSQNEQMGLDILLNPVEAAQISGVDDLAEAYARVDAVLSRFYDLVIYDLGLGFRDEAIRGILGLSDELVLISDAEVIPNAQLPDALRYVEGLGVNLAKTTLTINHGRPPEHESAQATEVRSEFAGYVRRVTEVPYDATLSRLLNSRAFHIDRLMLPAR
ncbi:MAG: AAA family ATPase, partial [Rubrobacter sp.]|nr:AAA family ATPase [Rubrobacter sp.]